MTRKKYAYVAHRIDPDHSQKLGDFAVIHWKREEPEGCYQYASEEYYRWCARWEQRACAGKRWD